MDNNLPQFVLKFRMKIDSSFPPVNTKLAFSYYRLSNSSSEFTVVGSMVMSSTIWISLTVQHVAFYYSRHKSYWNQIKIWCAQETELILIQTLQRDVHRWKGMKKEGWARIGFVHIEQHNNVLALLQFHRCSYELNRKHMDAWRGPWTRMVPKKHCLIIICKIHVHPKSIAW
jgi:hypothetical protein